MMKFWLNVLRDRFLKPRAPFLPGADGSHVVGDTHYFQPQASRIVPQVPRYALNVFPAGKDALGSDQALLDVVTVGRSILNVVFEWADTSLYSPNRSKKNLDSQHARYEQLLRRVPAHLHTRAPIERVEALAWQYVGELNRDIAFMRRFARDDIDAYGLVIDFARTIGCGEAVEAALGTGAP